MKLMKHITIALVLCAIPAAAVGQATVSCDDCTHAVSVYRGEGGLIASTDADEVSWLATCNGVHRSDTLTPNDDGVVAMLLAGDLACQADDASFELGPIDDGGWYWLTMETNSAVGGLVSMDILDNATVDIANAGPGVTMTAGKGAVLLTETATGRVGLLPNILPEPPTPPAARCGPFIPAGSRAYTAQTTSNCMLGGGGTQIRLVGPGAHGSEAPITNSMVYRPTAGDVTVKADLWVDESGSYSSATPAVPNLGWLGKGQGNQLAATWSVSLHSGGPQAGDAAGAGVAVTEDGTTNGQATITVSANSSYCGRNANHTAVINILAAPGTNLIHPAPATGEAAGLPASLATIAAVTQLRVVCPPASSSANQGQELVPENPFPVE